MKKAYITQVWRRRKRNRGTSRQKGNKHFLHPLPWKQFTEKTITRQVLDNEITVRVRTKRKYTIFCHWNIRELFILNILWWIQDD